MISVARRESRRRHRALAQRLELRGKKSTRKLASQVRWKQMRCTECGRFAAPQPFSEWNCACGAHWFAEA